MAGGAGGRRRIDRDIAKLIERKYDVSMKDKRNEIIVKFTGPKDTAYEGGVWRVRVYLPENYPFKSPSIGFMNRIFHPNIDDPSGTVCLDVINQSWSALYDLTNVFDSFLPQLLTYPNPTDPLNGYAASLYLKSPDTFKKTVKDYIDKYATQEALLDQDPGCPSAECSELSDFSESEDESQETPASTLQRDTPTSELEEPVARKRIKLGI